MQTPVVETPAEPVQTPVVETPTEPVQTPTETPIINQTEPVMESAPIIEGEKAGNSKDEKPKVSKNVKIICTVAVLLVTALILFFLFTRFFIVG